MSVRPPSTNVPVTSANGAAAPDWRRFFEDLEFRSRIAEAQLAGVARVGNIPPNFYTGAHTFFERDISCAAIKTDDGAAAWTVNVDLFPPGTELLAINAGASGNITLSGTVTLQLAGGTSTGSRTIVPGGMAFIYLYSSSRAFVYGTGVT
jgi:hypothetical protein